MRFLATVLLLAATAFAQSKNPVTDTVRSAMEGRSKNIVAALEEMPADAYSYKPTADQMSFGHLAIHIAESNYLFCSKIAGVDQPKIDDLKETDAKDKLIAAVKTSFDFCSTSLAKTDDSRLGDDIDWFGGTKRPRVIAMFALTGGWADHYGAAAIYLRLKGLTPPTAKKK